MWRRYLLLSRLKSGLYILFIRFTMLILQWEISYLRLLHHTIPCSLYPASVIDLTAACCSDPSNISLVNQLVNPLNGQTQRLWWRCLMFYFQTIIQCQSSWWDYRHSIFYISLPPPCQEEVVAKPRNYMLMPVHSSGNYGLVIWWACWPSSFWLLGTIQQWRQQISSNHESRRNV